MPGGFGVFPSGGSDLGLLLPTDTATGVPLPNPSFNFTPSSNSSAASYRVTVASTSDFATKVWDYTFPKPSDVSNTNGSHCTATGCNVTYGTGTFLISSIILSIFLTFVHVFILKVIDILDPTMSKESKEESVEIVLNTKDTGVVIGYHGDTLEGLQLVLSLCVARNLGRFVRISIDVGDYKKNRTEFLKTLAQETKERVLAEGKEIAVPELKSWERYSD